MMQPGKYYIGDLCYVMHGEWDEFCALTIVGDKVLDGEFNLAKMVVVLLLSQPNGVTATTLMKRARVTTLMLA
jgi:hypothetical protein